MGRIEPQVTATLPGSALHPDVPSLGRSAHRGHWDNTEAQHGTAFRWDLYTSLYRTP